MGKIKGHIQEWLETYGYSLGYDFDNIPSLLKMDNIKEKIKRGENVKNVKYN